MSEFVPDKPFLRGVLLHYFIQKKTAAEAHRILVDTYGERALSEGRCRDWFRRFKDGNFDLEDRDRTGQPKKFEDKDLAALLDENPCQTQGELAEALGVSQQTVSKRLKAMGMVQKQGKFVSDEK